VYALTFQTLLGDAASVAEVRGVVRSYQGVVAKYLDRCVLGSGGTGTLGDVQALTYYIVRDLPL
jgi:hypothetical protein